MPQQMTEHEERANILLSFPGEDERTRRMTRRAARDTWSVEEYAEARTAAAEQEQIGFLPQETEPALVNRVLQALRKHEATRGTLGIAEMEGEAAIRHVSVSDLGDVGLPAGIPFLLSEIGVISVPAPAPGAEGAQMVQQAIRAEVPGLEVHPSLTYYATAEVPEPQQFGAGAIGYPAEAHLDKEAQEVWFEAALETGAAAETLPWGVARVKGPQSWALGYAGSGVRVAVLDTGSGPHIDLPVPVASATFVPGTTSADDDHGHGTHVAGTILALRNGRGVIGVAPRAQLMRGKVLDRNGSGQDAWIAAGIVWAVNHGARIINLSLGGPAASSVIDRALVYARSHGTAICAAAGNNFGGPVGYPARSPLCFAIAATDQNNHKAAFSACGPELDLAAPGVNILSTMPRNAYGSMSGTSMATPHVSSVSADVLNKRPSLTPTQLLQMLERTAVRLGPVTQFGYGLVQADRAVAIAALAAPPEELVPAALPIEREALRREEPVMAGAASAGRRPTR